MSPLTEAEKRAAAERYDAEQAAEHRAMLAEIAAEIAQMDGEELSEVVEQMIEHRSEAQAEHGMGAISMGWRNGEFAPLQTPNMDAWIRLGRERLAEIYPPAPAPAPAVTVAEDDLPF